MATQKFYLDQRNKKASVFPLKIKISHRSKNDYILTGYKLSLEEWDDQKEKIVPPFKNCGRANNKISAMASVVQSVIEDLKPHAKELTVKHYKNVAEKAIREGEEHKKQLLKNAGLDYVLNQAVDTTPCFYKYAQNVADRFYLTDRSGSASLIEQTITHLRSFSGKSTLHFKAINELLLEEFERWYLRRTNKDGKPNTLNGLAFFTKEIRRIYNIAIIDKACTVKQELYPFGRGKYKIKSEKKGHKNIDAGEIAKIFQLEISDKSPLWHHQNFFMYYFECWGMNFADIAYIKVYQVKDGRTKYRRRKTKYAEDAKTFDIKHSPIAQKIIDHYTKGKKNNDYVFPILDKVKHLLEEVKDAGGNRDTKTELANNKLFQKKFGNIRSNHIRRLTTIAKQADLSGELTTYIGRHSFFSIALKSGVSKSKISEMAGHADYKTTEHYMAGFDNEQLDQSAAMVSKQISTGSPANDHDELSTLLLHIQSNRTISARDYLKSLMVKGALPEDSTLLFKLISETDCKDGNKALQLISSFKETLENGRDQTLRIV